MDYGATSEDMNTLSKIEGEISVLQTEVTRIMKLHSEDSKEQGKLYEWQTSDGDKPGEGGAKYSFFHLLVVFILCFILGGYLVLWAWSEKWIKKVSFTHRWWFLVGKQDRSNIILKECILEEKKEEEEVRDK